MNRNIHRFEPAFDFTACESSALVHQGQAQISINGNTYRGRGEVRLEPLPRANIYLYGQFKDVPPIDALMPTTGQKTISSFSIDGRQVKGFFLNIGCDANTQQMTVEWCPESGPIVGVGNESTQMTRVIFHLFNFVDLVGTCQSTEEKEATKHTIEHVDLTFDGWNVELKSLFETRDHYCPNV